MSAADIVPRHALRWAQELINSFPAVVIGGARLGDQFVGGIVFGTASQGIQFGPTLVGLPISTLWEL